MNLEDRVKTHAELSEEHYHLVRTNPEYRMMGQMLLLEEQMAPAHYREETPTEEIEPVAPPSNLYRQLQQLKGLANHNHQKLLEILSQRKTKTKHRLSINK